MSYGIAICDDDQRNYQYVLPSSTDLSIKTNINTSVEFYIV